MTQIISTIQEDGHLARRGRKRKNFEARLRKVKKPRHSAIDHGTAELFNHRLALVPAKYVKDQRAGDPLGVLCLNNRITDEHRQAGIEYARLCWLMFGRPFPPAFSYGDDRIKRSDGSVGPTPSGVVKENFYRADSILLQKAGRRSHREVRNVAVELRYDWFKRQKIRGIVRHGDKNREDALRRGLQALSETITIWRLTAES